MKCFQLIFPAACCVCLLSNLGQADDSPLIPRYENAQWSYVTLEGEQRIEQKFDRVTRFKHEVSLARDGEDFFAISLAGKVTGLGTGRQAAVISNRFVIVRKQVPESFEERIPTGIVDLETGKRYQPPQIQGTVFDWKFAGGKLLSAAGKENKWGLHSLDGTQHLATQYDYLGPPNSAHGLCVCMKKIDGRRQMGYIDLDGKEVISPRFDAALEFHEGRAVVAQQRKLGYINTSGDLVQPCEFRSARPFSSGIAWVIPDPENYELPWQAVNRSFEPVFEKRYFKPENFQEEWAAVSSASTYEAAEGTGRDSLINRSGKIVFSTDVEEDIVVSSSGYAWVNREQGGVAIFKDGKLWDWSVAGEKIPPVVLTVPKVNLK